MTKRIMLSEIAQLFDPLGLTAQKWNHFRDQLTQLDTVSLPRWLGLLENSVVEIHGFSDASQEAMAAVVYLKVFNGNDSPRITLVCLKTKVAPLKRLTIPRLELSVAVLLAELVKYVRDQLDLTAAPVFFWTDSSVTHAWISSHHS